MVIETTNRWALLNTVLQPMAGIAEKFNMRKSLPVLSLQDDPIAMTI
jgi:hypothetical protein